MWPYLTSNGSGRPCWWIVIVEYPVFGWTQRSGELWFVFIPDCVLSASRKNTPIAEVIKISRNKTEHIYQNYRIHYSLPSPIFRSWPELCKIVIKSPDPCINSQPSCFWSTFSQYHGCTILNFFHGVWFQCVFFIGTILNFWK